MPIGARRTFRLGLVVALSLALGYGMELQFPFFAPVFGLMLTATPAPPPGLKGLLGLILVVTITLGVGLVVTPLLGKYPVSALLIIAVGIYLSTYISVGLGKAFSGTLLALGFALIPAVGLVSYGLALDLIEGMLIGIGVAIVSQWIAYPFFPEDPRKQATAKPPAVDAGESGWIALRAVLIIFPPLLLCLSNPSQYVPIIAKCVMLSQQGSTVSARSAGRIHGRRHVPRRRDRDRVLARAENLSEPVDVLPVDAAGRHLLRGQAVWCHRQPVSTGLLVGRGREYPDSARSGRRWTARPARMSTACSQSVSACSLA